MPLNGIVTFFSVKAKSKVIALMSSPSDVDSKVIDFHDSSALSAEVNCNFKDDLKIKHAIKAGFY